MLEPTPDPIDGAPRVDLRNPGRLQGSTTRDLPLPNWSEVLRCHGVGGECHDSRQTRRQAPLKVDPATDELISQAAHFLDMSKKDLVAEAVRI